MSVDNLIDDLQEVLNQYHKRSNRKIELMTLILNDGSKFQLNEKKELNCVRLGE